MEHEIVDRDTWDSARAELLRIEKELTRREDDAARQRRALPWVAVNDYVLQTDIGPQSLVQLFDGRTQLVVYHLQYGPQYSAACPVNSSIGDCLNAVARHLSANDVTVVLVSRAPIEKLSAYKKRMGWEIPWASSSESPFNFDFGASFTEEQVKRFLGPAADDQGLLPPIVAQNCAATGTDTVQYLAEAPVANVFALEDDRVYQTYSTTARGLEFVMNYYGILDRVPRGRDEENGFQLWIRRHDEYT